jgi:hypothetical protein
MTWYDCSSLMHVCVDGFLCAAGACFGAAASSHLAWLGLVVPMVHHGSSARKSVQVSTDHHKPMVILAATGRASAVGAGGARTMPRGLAGGMIAEHDCLHDGCFILIHRTLNVGLR